MNNFAIFFIGNVGDFVFYLDAWTTRHSSRLHYPPVVVPEGVFIVSLVGLEQTDQMHPNEAIQFQHLNDIANKVFHFWVLVSTDIDVLKSSDQYQYIFYLFGNILIVG